MAEVQKDNIGSAEDTLRFLDMVGLFSSQAMIALGKVINPATGKTDKNLAVARLFVDTLEMLERKTKGNLSGDEARALRATLTDLRLMFVEESKSTGSAPVSPQSDGQTKESTDSDETSTDDTKVKFHKKYE